MVLTGAAHASYDRATALKSWSGFGSRICFPCSMDISFPRRGYACRPNRLGQNDWMCFNSRSYLALPWNQTAAPSVNSLSLTFVTTTPAVPPPIPGNATPSGYGDCSVRPFEIQFSPGTEPIQSHPYRLNLVISKQVEVILDSYIAVGLI